MKQLLKRALNALNIVHTGFSESKPLGIATIIDDLQSAIDNWDAEPVCYRIKFTPRCNPYESWIHESNLDYIRDLRSSGWPCVIEELYNHPKPSKMLTDAEIRDIAATCPTTQYAEHSIDFARAIEKRILGGAQ